MKKTQIEHAASWQCQTCPDRPEFDSNVEMVRHLQGIHGLTELKGRKDLVSALDFNRGEYTNTYRWTFANDIQAVQCCAGRRVAVATT
jgi:hypothetical protein